MPDEYIDYDPEAEPTINNNDRPEADDVNDYDKYVGATFLLDH